VAASEWQSRKARDLVKILVTRRGHPTTRDALIEALWPEQDPRRTANRLSVALSTARSVLDPDRRFGPDHFLRSDRYAVRLDHDNVGIDVERFLDDAEAGVSLYRAGRRDEAVGLLEAAEAAYEGDFLEEDLYEDWAVSLREEARAAYVAVCRALTELAEEPRTAARYLRRALERDPYDEQTHLELVRALAAGRALGEAVRAYRAYSACMTEIGVEPAPFPRDGFGS
jgi:DNA-binding SARP family transcriptional activator